MSKSILILTFLVLYPVIMITGCTSNNDVQNSLQSMGFTEIQSTGYKFFGCGGGDYFKTGFVAKNPNGKIVKGVVCSGWLKGATVRFE